MVHYSICTVALCLAVISEHPGLTWILCFIEWSTWWFVSTGEREERRRRKNSYGEYYDWESIAFTTGKLQGQTKVGTREMGFWSWKGANMAWEHSHTNSELVEVQIHCGPLSLTLALMKGRWSDHQPVSPRWHSASHITLAHSSWSHIHLGPVLQGLISIILDLVSLFVNIIQILYQNAWITIMKTRQMVLVFLHLNSCWLPDQKSRWRISLILD